MDEREELEKEFAAWRIVKLINPDGRTAVIRIRMSRPERTSLAAYATAVEIARLCEAMLPTKPEGERQRAFEDALEGLASHNGFSEQVQVRTGLGAKDWLYYTTDRERFMGELNRALQGRPRYPIKISFYDDPDWAIWQQIIDDIRSRSKR